MASAADLKAEGNEHFRKDSFDEALAAYTKALELDPSEASIHRCHPFTPITSPHASRARTDAPSSAMLHNIARQFHSVAHVRARARTRGRRRW